MYSWDDPKDRVAIVQLNSELRHAELELLSAQCATDRLRLRFSPLDIARYAERKILGKAVEIAGALHHYYSSLDREASTEPAEEETPLGRILPVRNPAFPRAESKPAGDANVLDYCIVTKASPDLAWRIFTDCDRWSKFSDLYGSLRWIEGKPWQPGSCLLIEVVRPVRAQIEHRITTSVPARRLSWIDHGLGTTIEQWVHFEALPQGGTRVHTWAEFAGIARLIAGRPLRQVLLDFTTNWYENYRTECDQAAQAAAAE
jgi:hypothetical protein